MKYLSDGNMPANEMCILRDLPGQANINHLSAGKGRKNAQAKVITKVLIVHSENKLICAILSQLFSNTICPY